MCKIERVTVIVLTSLHSRVREKIDYFQSTLVYTYISVRFAAKNVLSSAETKSSKCYSLRSQRSVTPLCVSGESPGNSPV